MTTLAQYNREQKARYIASREAQCNAQTRQVESAVTALHSVLLRTLERRTYCIDFASLVLHEAYKPFDAQGLDAPFPPPVVDSFMPQTPSLFVRIIPPLMERYNDAVRAAQVKFEAELKEWETERRSRSKELQRLKDTYSEACADVDRRNAERRANVADYEARCRSLDPIRVSDYFNQVLQQYKPLQSGLISARAAYGGDSKQLVIEIDVPTTTVVPDVAQFRYVKKSDEIVPVKRSPTSTKALYADFLAQLALSVLYVAFSADSFGAADTVTLNCYAKNIEPSTGKPVRPCLISVRCTRDTFAALDLRNVDPAACLKGLHAQISRSAHDLEAVKPLVEFNMIDPRFVAKSDVLSQLDNRPNLAELSPSDFESLMTNLFEKMGLETKLTRASRDGGVDCVAWDMRPVIGGKVVIQAKRYRHTVGVSAVRDLFGTLMNEGAAKGILVTTSGYGKSAFEFASNKPIELITGSNLLYLLKEHADVDAKIEFPENWVDPSEQED